MSKPLTTTLVATAALVVMLATAAVALAANPHFNKASAAVNNDGSLTVSWKEGELPTNPLIDYVASANGTATWVCVNPGGNWTGQSFISDGALSAGGDFLGTKGSSRRPCRSARRG